MVGLPLPELTRAKLALLVSELVTNAVLHAELLLASPISLEVTVHAGRVRLVVHDCGEGFAAQPQKLRDPRAVGGQGLVIVAALSEQWGVDRDADGCTVWCEVVIDEDASVASDRLVTGAYVR